MFIDLEKPYMKTLTLKNKMYNKNSQVDNTQVIIYRLDIHLSIFITS
jgi:hypothetical protein